MFAELWVGGMYETFRLLNDQTRKLVPATDEYKSLASGLKLLRVPLEKHEIAGDRKLAEALQTYRTPPRDDDREMYKYEKMILYVLTLCRRASLFVDQSCGK